MHLRYIVLFVSLRWVRLPPWNRFKHSSKYFTDRSKAVLLLWIICVIYVLYFSCDYVCSLLPCGHLLGKGWPLGSCLWCVFVTFPCGIMGQVWYLIASIPEFCRLSYFSWWHVAVVVLCIFLTVSTMDWSAVCGISLPYTLTFLASSVSTYTRGIWKVLSMVLYLSNRFTNPIICGIVLKSYLSSMLWHKFNEYIIMQTRKLLLWIHVLFVYGKTQNFSGKYNILPFEKCAEHWQ